MEEALEDLLAMLAVHHLRMELDTGKATIQGFHGCHRGPGTRRTHHKAVRSPSHAVTV